MGLRYGDSGQIADVSAELEELGYTVLWIPDAGGDVFEGVERLLGATRTIIVATGILNLWMHTPEESAAAHARLIDRYGDRFLMGIGVSHGPLIDKTLGGGRYSKPMAAMEGFLDSLDVSASSPALERRVLAALGPRMLELARRRAAGAHPYNVTPEHTGRARAILGPSKLLLPEQAVVLTTSAEEGRDLGRQRLVHSLSMPNYLNHLRRLGFTDDDFASGGSDRLIDALVVWGDEEAIAARVREHREAGADHVCVQVLSREGDLPVQAWRALAPALMAGSPKA